MFTAPLNARFHPQLGKCGLWENLKTFWYQRPNGDQIMVPKGVFSDLASTRNIPGFPQDDRENQEAFLHDFLYQSKLFTRKQCDDIFYEAMLLNHYLPEEKIKTIYRAVRIFGYWLAWRNKNYFELVHARKLAGLHDFKKEPLWPDGQARFI